MLKIIMDDRLTQIEADGSLSGVTADLGRAIRSLHSALEQRDKAAADQFRMAVILMVADPLSPMWTMPPVHNGIGFSGGLVKRRETEK